MRIDGDWTSDELTLLDDALNDIRTAVGNEKVFASIWGNKLLTRVRIFQSSYRALADWVSGNITFWNETFQKKDGTRRDPNDVKRTIAHEFGHSWDSLATTFGMGTLGTTLFVVTGSRYDCYLPGGCQYQAGPWDEGQKNGTPINPNEDWAESFASFVYPGSPENRTVFYDGQLSVRLDFIAYQVSLQQRWISQFPFIFAKPPQ